MYIVHEDQKLGERDIRCRKVCVHEHGWCLVFGLWGCLGSRFLFTDEKYVRFVKKYERDYLKRRLCHGRYLTLSCSLQKAVEEQVEVELAELRVALFLVVLFLGCLKA